MKKILKLNHIVSHKKIWLNSMIGMTWGFMATLIFGTIIGLFAKIPGLNFLNVLKLVFTYITPFGIGIGVGIKMKMDIMQIFAIGIACFITGQSLFIPTFTINTINWTNVHIAINYVFFKPGDVFAAWIMSVIMIYLLTIFSWNGLINILLLPLIGASIGIIGMFFITYITSTFLICWEWVIDQTINKSYLASIFLAPILGIFIGAALTLPTSSAAIALALHLHGNAAIAAMAATSAQMISFAVLTYIANKKLSLFFVIGLGSSMLQLKNIMKKPMIFIIPLIVSGLAATFAIIVFGNNLLLPFNINEPGDFIISGMGMCAFYGPIFTLKINGWTNGFAYLHILIFQIFLPFLFTISLFFVFQKNNWYQKEWMIIQNN